MTEPVWLELPDALAVHEGVLAIHGGPEGTRDESLLASALARPRQLFAYAQTPDAADLAAAYAFGIVRNHPFVDGNKRTAFVLAVLFLELNGYRFNASEEDAAQTMISLAGGELEERDYAAFLRNHATVT